MNDTISDLINRINNARLSGKDKLEVPFSNVKMAILAVLREEGYISGYKKDSGKAVIMIGEAKRVFNKIRRISSPGRRIYAKSKNIPRPKGGFGEVIVSTPKGMLSGKKARKIGVGGELICEIY
ncbi:MAG: 30S ribosomal protein S8 [Candidatus Berkelbacteria bacterium]|nr:30S ribosomal protein S8 [Candidatus Berkelbacteria bacterium]